METPPPDPRRQNSLFGMMSRRPRGTIRILLALLVAGLLVAAAWFFWAGTGRVADLGDVTLSETTIRSQVHAVLQREADESFLLTGRLDLLATTEVEDTRTVLPGVLDLDLGTSRATVRVPGRIFYGVPLQGFSTDHVELVGDSLVRVTLPAPRVKAVEPAMAQMQVRTERGWARLPARSERDAEREAVRLVTATLHRQGQAHLADSRDPGERTARAVAALLRPVLEGTGMASPVLHLTIGERTWVVRD